MKYLKKYHLFKENDSFEISDTDDPDIKLSKEKLADLKKKLSEYNSKKSAIDNLYKSDKIDDSELEKIVGKDEDKNTFLVSYSNISSMNKKLNDLKEKENKKAVELSNFKDRLSDASDDSKSIISAKISEIDSQISKIRQDIAEISKKIPELEKEHKEKMVKIEDDMKSWIQKIQ